MKISQVSNEAPPAAVMFRESLNPSWPRSTQALFRSYVMVTSSPGLQESTRSFSSTTHIERGMWRLSRNSCVTSALHTHTLTHPHILHDSSLADVWGYLSNVQFLHLFLNFNLLVVTETAQRGGYMKMNHWRIDHHSLVSIPSSSLCILGSDQASSLPHWWVCTSSRI